MKLCSHVLSSLRNVNWHEKSFQWTSFPLLQIRAAYILPTMDFFLGYLTTWYSLFLLFYQYLCKSWFKALTFSAERLELREINSVTNFWNLLSGHWAENLPTFAQVFTCIYQLRRENSNYFPLLTEVHTVELNISQLMVLKGLCWKTPRNQINLNDGLCK